MDSPCKKALGRKIMNQQLQKPHNKIVLVVMVLLLAQLSCGGIDPKSPIIPEIGIEMSNLLIDFLYPLQISPPGVQLPPIIIQVSDKGDGKYSVSGKSRNDPFKMVSTSGAMEAKVLIYKVKLSGCRQEPKPNGDPLDDAQILANRNWAVEIDGLKPGDVIGATQLFDGKETGLSNLMVIGKEVLTIDFEDKLKDPENEYILNGLVVVTGKSIPGACVVVQNQDAYYGREASYSIGDTNEWKVEIIVRDTDNKYNVFVEGWDNVAKEISLRGGIPKLQWPYKDKDITTDGSCNYKDTKDKQEKRIKNCYYKAPISAWYDRNDFYVQKGYAGGFHNAIDIAGESGSAVYSVAKGEVFYINISDVKDTGGNYILIDHGSWVSAYMHLSKITISEFITPSGSSLIKPPKMVEAGQKIGETGNSGTKDPHLHFSAFQWANGYREASLGENNIPKIPWMADDTTSLLKLNVNPPAGNILGSGENTTDRLADRRDPNNSITYFSSDVEWLVNWNEIRINEYGCASGTKFDELTKGVVIKDGQKIEVWTCD